MKKFILKLDDSDCYYESRKSKECKDRSKAKVMSHSKAYNIMCRDYKKNNLRWIILHA